MERRGRKEGKGEKRVEQAGGRGRKREKGGQREGKRTSHAGDTFGEQEPSGRALAQARSGLM